MANKKVWELLHHENVETPYFEITNGPISLCIDEEDIPFEETKLCKDWCDIIAKSLSLPYNVRSENKLELDLHIQNQILIYALEDIARQRTCAETEADEEIPIGSDGSRLGDINFGYDSIIGVARQALESIKKK